LYASEAEKLAAGLHRLQGHGSFDRYAGNDPAIFAFIPVTG